MQDKYNRLVSTTFSPMMMGKGQAHIRELKLGHAVAELKRHGYKSVVGHEITAGIISTLTGLPIEFNRESIQLGRWDVLFCIIPNFRANVAREFTKEEISGAGYRCFRVRMY